MPARFSRLRCAAPVALGLLFAAPAVAQAPLPKDSPFVPAGAPPVAAAAGEVYEFAAVSTIDKKTSVNIYDKQAKRGRWIAVGAAADGIEVKNYDAAREQVVVRIGGIDKVLTLRKATGVGHTSITVPGVPQVVASATPGPAFAAPAAGGTGAVQLSAVSVQPAGTGTAPASPVPATPAAPPPPAPGSVAHQEQEARMLVSDLLEIGMAQRKAYEEAQKKAAEQRGSSPAPAKPPGN